jgi:predicted outer membrane protein
MLSKMKGQAFDRMFAQHMVADHQKDIAAYQRKRRTPPANTRMRTFAVLAERPR